MFHLPITDTGSNSVNSKFFSTQEIHFSQASVSPLFTDGTLVSDLSQKLVQGEVDILQIPFIRVVSFQRKWVSMDNRRLRAFKDAMIEKIPVIVCDLKDPEICREFHDKRTNKSSNGGGVIRTFTTPGSTQHFDDGTFVFTKRILNLTFEQIAQPSLRLKYTSPLPSNFNSAEQYYAGFLELIFEEARASLQAGIEAIDSAENKAFELFFQRYKPPKNPESPAPIFFSKKMEEKRLIKAYDAFLLTCFEFPHIKLVALANYAPTEDSQRVQLKVVVEQNIYIQGNHAFQSDVKWLAKPIGSLVTHLRMYDVCTAKPDIKWLNELLTGNIRNIDQIANPVSVSSISHGLSTMFLGTLASIGFGNFPAIEKSDTGLNTSQQNAVDRFLELDSGMQLVQGPPGTGKTTMVVSLLASLAKQGRTLVCAPSNKAVQVLAEKFVLAHPDLPAILAGVEDKLPEDNMALRQIFVHTWGELKLEEIAHIKDILWTLLPNNVFVGTPNAIKQQLSNAINQIKLIDQSFMSLMADFKKYSIEVSISLDFFKQTIERYTQYITVNIKNLPEIRSTVLKEDFSDPQKWYQDWNTLFNAMRITLTEIASFLTQIDMFVRNKMADDSNSGLEGMLLNQSVIIFATLSVSGRKMLKEMHPVRALVVDEAGQALEAETLIPLVTRPKKCLLIGDTKQLPATVISSEATKLKFDRSLMWRLLEDCQQPYTLLNTQYRMHPDIRHWPANQYYGGRILDSDEIASGQRTALSKNLPRFIAPYSFINVESKEQSIGYSFRNREEADSIANIMQYLKHQFHLDVASQCGIITFYKAQAVLIQEKLGKIFPGVKVNTVDSFQGDENDIILISCVRSNPAGNIGFVNDFRRLNVALTRAKHGLMIIGNAATLDNGERDLALLVKDARERECFFNYADIRQSLAPKPKLPAFDESKKVKKQKPTKSVCRFDQAEPGSCRYGSNCQFSHAGNPPKDTPPSKPKGHYQKNKKPGKK